MPQQFKLKKSNIQKCIWRIFISCGILCMKSFSGFAQCSYDNAQIATWEAPLERGDSLVTDCIQGGEFVRVSNMVKDSVYEISTCGINDFDAEITIYPEGGGDFVDYGYGDCLIVFIPPVTGTYDILVDEYGCLDNNGCASLKLKKTNCTPIQFAFVDFYPQNPICPGEEIMIDAFTYPYEGDYSYEWFFYDDFFVSEDPYIFRTFDSSGTYEFHLFITDKCGHDFFVEDTVVVDADLQLQYADMNIHPLESCPDDTITFNALYEGGFSDYDFLWALGNNDTVVNDDYFYYAYSALGAYPVSLTLTNRCGSDITLHDTVNVGSAFFLEDTVLSITPNPAFPYDSASFRCNADSLLYHWSFDDGDTSTLRELSRYYTMSGNYPIALTLTDTVCKMDTTFYDTLLVDEIVSGQTLPADNLSPVATVLPNPNKGQFFVRLHQEEISVPVLIQINSLNGEIIYHRTLRDPDVRQLYIDLSGVAPGIYFLQLHGVKTEMINKQLLIH